MSCGVTDPFIAKQRLAMLASVLVAILCQQHVHSLSVMKTSQWQKSNSKISSNSMPVTARSKVECAALCLRHTRCFRFCHNPDTLACIHGHGATSGSGEDYDDNSTCYDKVTSKTTESLSVKDVNTLFDSFILGTVLSLKLHEDFCVKCLNVSVMYRNPPALS